ncbi:MAG: hypothetical protein H6765_00125 [Candidatus Peribacteria bacterium]|nr:MAG: hypothetical protein H6765_00125 [Candidatus Peribacteria bacterium]
MTGFSQFDDVWQAINTETVAVLPIENSYAGSVHTNMYRFLRYEYRIYHAYDFAVHHCLLSTATDPTTITQVYSHWQALEQCYSYCAAHDYQQMPYGDTAGAAEMVAEAQNPSYGAIASSLAAELY